jgi:hypothetical protein
LHPDQDRTLAHRDIPQNALIYFKSIFTYVFKEYGV